MTQTKLRKIELREVQLSPAVIEARKAAAQKRREMTSEQLAKKIRAERLHRSLRRAS